METTGGNVGGNVKTMKTFHMKPKTNAKTKMISIIFLPSYKAGLSNNRPMSNDVVFKINM